MTDERTPIPPPKRPERCPHGFHIFAFCEWCWQSGKADNRA